MLLGEGVTVAVTVLVGVTVGVTVCVGVCVTHCVTVVQSVHEEYTVEIVASGVPAIDPFNAVTI